MWAFFDRPSMYGQEIATQGGKRGPARAYYLPSLSAMQLFLPAEAPNSSDSSRPLHQIYCREADWGPGWSQHMRPLAEFFEHVRIWVHVSFVVSLADHGHASRFHDLPLPGPFLLNSACSFILKYTSCCCCEREGMR